MTIDRIPITSRAQWLDLRRQDVTASDIGALVGASPYKSRLNLWMEKTGIAVDAHESDLMRRGRWLEPAVLAAVIDQHPDWEVEPLKIYLRDTELRIGATPDAKAIIPEAGEAIIQCKVISKPVFDDKWRDGPPLYYILQTLTEAMLYGTDTAWLAVLVIDTFTADLQMFPVFSHPEAEARIRDEVGKFWQAIKSGGMPIPDYSLDGEILKMIYPPVKGAEPIDLRGDNMLPELLASRAGLKAAAKEGEELINKIDAEIIHKLAGAPAAICDGWKITNSVTHRRETVIPAKSFPVLRVTKLKEALNG